MERKLDIKTYGYLEDPDTIIQNILKARGIDDPDRFLNPPLLEIIDPLETPRIEEGVNILVNGLKNQMKFFLSVDSDTDGITSGTIMYKWLQHHMENLGYDQEIYYYVSQGKTHGLSDELLEELQKSAADILIVMDSLDSSLDRYQQAVEMGVEVLVVDHHDISKLIPYDSLITLVSSNRSTNPHLSGAGMVWKLCCLADVALNDRNYTLWNLTDLAAVGLVADMMDVGISNYENRAIINYGLKNLMSSAVTDIKGHYDFNTNCISFSIAPLINAACRYFQNDLAFEAFIEEDTDKRKSFIDELKDYKEKQDSDIKEIRSLISDQIKEQENQPFFFLEIDTPWGISGLLANQIMSKYQKPVFVVKQEDGIYKGSGRSNDVNLRELVHGLTSTSKGFGHPRAFGFFCDIEDRKNFENALSSELESLDTTIIEEIDCALDVDDLTSDLIYKVKSIDRISGMNFRPLRFMVEVKNVWPEVTRNGKHLVFKCDDNILYIKWKAADDIENLKDINEDTVFRFIGTVDSGPWGRKFYRKLIIDSYEILEEPNV